MGTALHNADQTPPSSPTLQPARRKRERIQLMETRPQDEWFQSARDPWGREVWFLRVQVTGLRTRRYGPFETKHKGLLFLDRLLDDVCEGLCEAGNNLERYQPPKRPFGFRAGHYPVVEDELSS